MTIKAIKAPFLQSKKLFILGLVSSLFVAAPCYADVTGNQDPYEGFNRTVFKFNDTLDTNLLKPVATFYNKVMPKPLNRGIHNVFNNINTLPTIANDLLQLHLYQMTNDLWRLAINTTVGIGGLFDVAKKMNLQPYRNDFGLTLARWGFGDGNYLVLPFFGPKTLRDTFGMPVDYYAFSIYPYIHPARDRYALYGYGVLDNRANLLQYQSVMDAAAIDKYTFVRNAYMQTRNYQIEQNQQQNIIYPN